MEKNVKRQNDTHLFSCENVLIKDTIETQETLSIAFRFFIAVAILVVIIVIVILVYFITKLGM